MSTKKLNSQEQIKIIINDKEKNNFASIIEHGEKKIKQITRRILENQIKIESMVSHSDYEYQDLLKEYIEAEKEHKLDLRLFVEFLEKNKN